MKLSALLCVFFLLPGFAQAQHDHKHDSSKHETSKHGKHETGEHDVHQKGMHHSFSDAEKWAERFDDPARVEWQKPAEVVDLMEIDEGMVAVDIGAGTGYFLGDLSAAVGAAGQVFGLDVEPDMVDYMNRRAEREGWSNTEARKIPYDDPQLADGSVDRILIVNTWHHIDDRAAYSAKLLQALKEDGRVYVVDFTKDSPEGPPAKHRLEPEQVIAELAAGGLQAEVIEEPLTRQYIVVARR